MMKSIKALIFLMVINLLSGCSKDNDLIPEGLIGNWRVISFDDNVNHTKVFKTSTNTWPEFNNGDNTITFTRGENNGGDISGISVTNTFVGGYEIYSNDGILITEGTQTLIAEPEWGLMFHVLGTAENYALTGDVLIIYYNQYANSITLERTLF